MLGLKRRRVRRCECDTFMPNPGPLPQTSHTEATGVLQSSLCQSFGSDHRGKTPGRGSAGGGGPPAAPRSGAPRPPCQGSPAGGLSPKAADSEASPQPASTLRSVSGSRLPWLDADVLRRWCRRAADALALAAPGIDALNVFPVADADTGTNMLVTMRAAADAAEVADCSVADTAEAVAAGALRGAQGSSGVILGRYLGAFTAALARTDEGGDTGGADLCRALE